MLFGSLPHDDKVFIENWTRYAFQNWTDRGSLSYNQILAMPLENLISDPRYSSFNPFSLVPQNKKSMVAKVLFKYADVNVNSLVNRLQLVNPTPRASVVVTAPIPEAYRVQLESTLSTWANPPAGSNAGPAAVDSNSNLSSGGAIMTCFLRIQMRTL
jgi:hypothetical protein